MMASPFFFAGELAFEISTRMPGSHVRNLGWAVFWLIVYAAGAAVWLQATLLTFNRCLGRVENGLPELRRHAAKKAAWAELGEDVGTAWVDEGSAAVSP
jgi:hypothetical protein